jgi:hypothetical protein
MYEIGSSWKTDDVLLAAVDAVAGAGLVVFLGKFYQTVMIR